MLQGSLVTPMTLAALAAPQPSEYDFELQHGVVKVWTDSSRETVLADAPGNSYEFFVDMHRRARHDPPHGAGPPWAGGACAGAVHPPQ